MTDALKVSLGKADDILANAVLQGGGQLVPIGSETRALVWNRFHDPKSLLDALGDMPALEWVQLPSAGVEDFIASGVMRPSYLWTSAKGAYAAPVAEHALTLTLAALRQIPMRARARSWGQQEGKSLFGLHVAIIGAGGIAQQFMRLTKPFGVRTTIVRRSEDAVEGAHATMRLDQLHTLLPDVDVLLLATPLTDETRGIVGERELALLPRDAVLVNVARGGLVRTDELVASLRDEVIAAAALDVTDPEPLPADHPLWQEPRALITPHTADTAAMIYPLLVSRICENVRRYSQGQPLLGVVDPDRGY